MTPEIVRHLDFWLECMQVFPTQKRGNEEYVKLVKRYKEALESL